jgi:plastocyanin domain-containing protein
MWKIFAENWFAIVCAVAGLGLLALLAYAFLRKNPDSQYDAAKDTGIDKDEAAEVVAVTTVWPKG